MRLRYRTLICLLSFFTSLASSNDVYAQSRSTISDLLNVRASSRIVGEINDGVTRLLRGNRHPLARAEFDAGSVAAELPMQRMVLLLQPSAAQANSLDALLEALQNPASQYFHQWLTPEQFAERFGASVEDVQRIENWLQSHGMQIDEIAPSRRAITFSGTASQVERAFATRIRQYRVNGALHVANSTDPSIPEALAPVVAGVLSMHDFPLHATLSSRGTPVSQMTYGNAHYITPGDLAVIYDVNALYTQGVDGSGQSIAVVARSNINLSDVHSFRASYGLPANDPQVIVNGANPGTSNSGELMEATLDAEYAGALARSSTVKIVTSASTSASDGSYLSAQYIVNQNLAPVMTMSFGVCEAEMSSSGNAFIASLWQQAAAQGITVLVSAGDSGAAGCDSASSTQAQYGLGVNGLCSTPYDLCVGGTEFNDTANPSQYWSASNVSGSNTSALGYIPEVVWNESAPGLWAGGGGSSTVYSKPAWQSGEGVPSDGMRDVPDLSLTAAGHDGYMIFASGQQFVVAGTSAATPSLAGIFALVAQSAGGRLGIANSTLYALANQPGSAAAFHDVTDGNNSVPGLTGYSATAGYDPASGLGSVDANELVTHWRDGQTAPSIQLTLSTSSITLAPSASSPITVHVTTSGGDSAAVTLSASGLPNGMNATFSPANIPATGTSTMQLAATSTVAAGSYNIRVAATSGSLSSPAVAYVTVVVPALTIVSSTNPTIYGGAVTFTATIAADGLTGIYPATGTLPGTVSFQVGGKTIGTTKFSGNTATLSNVTVSTANGFSVGSNSITAIYNGDLSYGTQNATATLTVAAPTYTLTAGPTAVSTSAGGSATVVLTLTSINYTGTVTMTAVQ